LTTTAIQLDAVGGIAGDMFVAAMIDALPELRDRALADAAAVLPPGVGVPLLESGVSGGLRCLRFRLSGATEHTHDGDHTQASFRGMVARIEGAGLASGTAPQAIAILRHLAEAEAAIHDVPLDDVHFHEIGDWDSLMDVVAAGSIAAALPSAQWTVSDLPLGGGMVRTQHGLLPVPAPATARLLQGFAWRDDGIGGERVTPTGAAILRHLVTETTAPIAGRLRASGTGAGLRELPGQPNVLRVTVFDQVQTASDFDAGMEDILVLSFDIDDMTGEEIGVAAERLRRLAGVRDLVVLSASGKKGRPVHVFRLLLQSEDRAIIAAACFTETSTIGLRWRQEGRMTLAREYGTAKPPAIRVKTAFRPAGNSRKAESDDLAEIEGLENRRAAKRQAEEAE
jgi:pyridinium-3,5-bisthiocarboxylic acid mononucleotide nickel chelatase